MTAQMQGVIATRLADRHESEGRAFAASAEFVVPAGDLSNVLRAVADQLPPSEPGRYTIVVSEPYDLAPTS